MIGYSAHGAGPLCPPSPELECRLCNCGIWTYEQLENGLCEECVEEFVCIECGEEKDQLDAYGVCKTCKEVNDEND